MKRVSLRLVCVALGAVLSAGAFGCIFYLRKSLGRGLPFHDRFQSGTLNGWRAQGGEWYASDIQVVNNSNETGSRLLSGSEALTDYKMDADVRLTDSYGDAGLVVRVTESEEGTNSFFGYYAGLRFPDSLILARMDYGYQPLHVVKLPVPVIPGTWYHLSMQARGCTLYVSALDEQGHQLASAKATDAEECQTHGNFGLRSFAAGGSWRNVRVEDLR